MLSVAIATQKEANEEEGSGRRRKRICFKTNPLPSSILNGSCTRCSRWGSSLQKCFVDVPRRLVLIKQILNIRLISNVFPCDVIRSDPCHSCFLNDSRCYVPTWRMVFPVTFSIDFEVVTEIKFGGDTRQV